MHGYENTTGIVVHTEFYRYIYSNQSNMSTKQWVSLIHANQIEPNYTSAAKPNVTHENGILVVVASTFAKLVIEEPRTVFIIYYAPWDCYSKSAIEEMEKLVPMISNNEIVVAKIDGEKNQHPIIGQADAYPSMYIFWANQKHTPQLYIGSHDAHVYFEVLQISNRRDEL